jgi:hypothetical protein
MLGITLICSYLLGAKLGCVCGNYICFTKLLLLCWYEYECMMQYVLGGGRARHMTCSRSLWRAASEDKRMVLVHTHDLFIT